MPHAKLLLAAVLLPSCAATIDEPAQATDVPERVYDFSPRRIDDPAPAPPAAGDSAKRRLVFAMAGARPAIRACLAGTNHPGGEIDVTLTLALDTDVEVTGALVEAFGDLMLARCIHDALLATDVSAIEPLSTPERWTIHAPLVTDANYTGKQ